MHTQRHLNTLKPSEAHALYSKDVHIVVFTVQNNTWKPGGPSVWPFQKLLDQSRISTAMIQKDGPVVATACVCSIMCSPNTLTCMGN